MASSTSSLADSFRDDKVFIVDAVTTEFESDEGEIVEIAAALYSVQHRCILSQVSTLLPLRRPSATVSKIHKIPFDATHSIQAQQTESVCQILLSWAQEAKFCVAHNAEQHRKWMADHWLLAPLCQQVWLCSAYDFVWPRQQRPGMNLVHSALAHGIAVTCAQRALSSCQLIAALMTEAGDKLPELIVKASRPKCKVLAKIPNSACKQAQNAGFKWDATMKAWSRWMAIEDLASLCVKYTVTEVDPRGNRSVIWARLWQMYLSHKNGDGASKENVALEELGHRLWLAIRDNTAFSAAVQRLWTESEGGSIKPKGLVDAIGAMEIWYLTVKHPFILTKKYDACTNSIYNLPDALGSESGDATSQSDDACDQNSVESVVEKVAESCLEPEDRQSAYCPSYMTSGTSISTD